MEFRLLGPLEVSDGRGPISIPGRRQRALLARLLLDANRTVVRRAPGRRPVGRRRPRLRREDGPHPRLAAAQAAAGGHAPHAPARLRCSSPTGEAIDLVRFERLRRRGAGGAGRRRRRDGGGAAARGAGALARPGARPSSPSRSRCVEAAHLEELRMRLPRGPHRRRPRAAGATPTWSASSRRWSRATRCGSAARPADARPLPRRAARPTRSPPTAPTARELADELGLEPSRGVRELERRILRQDAALDLASEPAATCAAQLQPPAVQVRRERRRLDRLPGRRRRPARHRASSTAGCARSSRVGAPALASFYRRLARSGG